MSEEDKFWEDIFAGIPVQTDPLSPILRLQVPSQIVYNNKWNRIWNIIFLRLKLIPISCTFVRIAAVFSTEISEQVLNNCLENEKTPRENPANESPEIVCERGFSIFQKTTEKFG